MAYRLAITGWRPMRGRSSISQKQRTQHPPTTDMECGAKLPAEYILIDFLCDFIF
jgi:hypothetical protein